jgi:rhodanese-related sulfurtransferase
MKRSFAVLGIAILAVAAVYAQSSYRDSDDCPCKYLGVGVPWSEYSDPAKLTALIDGKAESYILVDVRGKEEFESGHIPTAINIPVDEIASRPPTEAKDALIILYCRSGVRSAKAASILRDLGYKGVIDFGGVSRWKGSLRAGPESPAGR